ncbi:transient receptor potential cation channel subfamily M member 3-like isoform X2 [Liolophura sinensis]|uniref:transient receptor potential cation channel subfamily M member 3-like isoform X2 n=1 Tax=Liolophura sinensis TaxID=3198878 RepID=UPI00315864D8
MAGAGGVDMPLMPRRQAEDTTSLIEKQVSQRSWIEKVFLKRECIRFIASTRDATKCCCGRGEAWHCTFLPSPIHGSTTKLDEKWHPNKHTEAKPTDAYGTIEFQGAPHPSKAQYMRLSSLDTKPEFVLQLLQKQWGLELPKLLITVHGGISNFELQPKLKRVFRKGLLKAAKTTGAWIFTAGTNTGVTHHVGDAISDRTTKTRNKVVAIGIAPWGVVENREDLIGRDVVVPYHCVSSPKSNYAVLNSNHSYFLLVDNGTVGKYGGEILFRKKMEKFISHQKICISSGVKGRGVPVICVVLEGGTNTIRSVLDYVTDSPPVPVVVCDGSGRAADLLAFSHKYTNDDGTMPESLRDQLILTIQKTFQYTLEQAEKLFIELMLCVKKKELITVFRMGEENQDIDLAILTALLKGTNTSAPDQLSLALTWDRVDIARSHIFVYGQEWPEGSLEQAMMDALINDRVDFVKLLLENGVSMHTFLTIPRLEELYNTKQGPSNTLRYLVRDLRKSVPSQYRYTLPDLGMVTQHLMGGAFRSMYCRRRFRQKYNAIKQNGLSVGNVVTTVPNLVNLKQAEELFPYPFHDLMIWAVLMKRQKMALFMWQHGEEAMAKALMACKLYKAMAHVADQDDLEVDISDELRRYAKEFQILALELLEHCYKIDDDYTQQLLTYELKNFSDQTCLSLAVAAYHREFIAHTCCQILLTDMWMGGLLMRKSTSLKVILCILFPPYIQALEFKSKEELQLMPQTMEEHLDDLEDAADNADRISLNSFNEEQVIENEFGDEIDAASIASEKTNQPEDSSVNADLGNFPSHANKKKKSPLRLGKKIYEFYNAPITKFWAHTMAYIAFLATFTYVVLVKTLPNPRVQEYYVMAYIMTAAIEKVREIIASEPAGLWVKLTVYFNEIWNVWDCAAILIFLVALCLRMDEDSRMAARVLYTIDIVFWYIRILEILSVNKNLGPYVKIIGKLVVDMSYYIIILLIVLMSFGIVRQSIHFPNEEPSWRIVRNMFFYPYWMIYGELFADEIDPCEDTESDSCVYGSWVSPALMTMYLLVANILMVNLLIARFNATFLRNNAMSREIWKFQRYHLIIEYEMKPILPPPLIVFSHLYLAAKYIKRRCKGKRDYFDNGLKLFLSHEDKEKLHDFEEECMVDYFREKENKFQSSSDERIRVTNERIENMTMRMDDMNQKENCIKLSLQGMDYRLSKLEEVAIQTSSTLSLVYEFMNRHMTQPTSMVSVPSHESLLSTEEGLKVETSHTIPIKETSSSVIVSSGEETIFPMNAEDHVPDDSLKSIPTPSLVHSKRPVKQKCLKMFTDYSKTYLSRPSPLGQLQRSYSQRTPRSSRTRLSRAHRRRSDSETMACRRTQSARNDFGQHVSLSAGEAPMSHRSGSRSSTSHSSASIPRVSSTGLHHPVPISPGLLQRRQGKTSRLRLNIYKAVDESSSSDENIPAKVSCSSGSHSSQGKQPSPSVFRRLTARTSSKDQPPTSLTLGDPDKPKEDCPNVGRENLNSPVLIRSDPIPIANAVMGNDFHNPPIQLPMSPVAEISGVPYSTPVSHSRVDEMWIPSAMVRPPMTPILTPMRAEYTSITDDIDTSCMMDISPNGSPQTPRGRYMDSMKEDEDGQNVSKLDAFLNEQAILKKAEERECRKMERVIRHRLRQISLDDSDSISNIAKLVVSEMNLTDIKTLEDEGNDEEEDDEMEEDIRDQSTSVQEDRLMADAIEIRVSHTSLDKEGLV